jgi:hypothetical protein
LSVLDEDELNGIKGGLQSHQKFSATAAIEQGKMNQISDAGKAKVESKPAGSSNRFISEQPDAVFSLPLESLPEGLDSVLIPSCIDHENPGSRTRKSGAEFESCGPDTNHHTFQNSDSNDMADLISPRTCLASPSDQGLEHDGGNEDSSSVRATLVFPNDSVEIEH